MCACIFSDLLLGGNGEFVAGDEAAHLLQSQTQELLSLHHLTEMLLWEAQVKRKKKNKKKKNK